MWSYTMRRLLSTLPTLLVVITVCYVMLHLTPGGPFDREHKIPEAVMLNLQTKYHLNEPLWKQYLLYLQSLLQGDLGASFRYEDWTVNELVSRALPVSLAIGGGSMVIAAILGVVLGVFAALRRNSVIDYLVMFLGNIGLALPSFVMGPVLILIFAIWLQLTPSGGWSDFAPRYMILPMSMLVLINLSTVARVMRGSMIEVLHSNFIRTAKAKGVPRSLIVWRHAMRPALLPVVSLLGPLTISSITAAVVTESVFSLPGIGKLIVNGASNRDYTLVLGLVVLITVMAVTLNLLVDLAYALLDPRIRY